MNVTFCACPAYKVERERICGTITVFEHLISYDPFISTMTSKMTHFVKYVETI